LSKQYKLFYIFFKGGMKNVDLLICGFVFPPFAFSVIAIGIKQRKKINH